MSLEIFSTYKSFTFSSHQATAMPVWASRPRKTVLKLPWPISSGYLRYRLSGDLSTASKMILPVLSLLGVLLSFLIITGFSELSVNKCKIHCLALHMQVDLYFLPTFYIEQYENILPCCALQGRRKV